MQRSERLNIVGGRDRDNRPKPDDQKNKNQRTETI